ncbi:MAG: hypothetical protein MJ177_05315 [Clostridia bacterium]|nr:hypothetical protein [Clostridia bacterium]
MSTEYKLSVPVMNLNFFNYMSREKTVELFKKMGVKRVFIASESESIYGSKKEAELHALRENAAYLHSHGFEVGAWFWAFMDRSEEYVRMTSPGGEKSREMVCATDESYCEKMFSFIRDCGQTGIDMIMFDDDFRYGFHDIGFGCLCENHLARIRAVLGENVSREQVREGIMTGGKNKYRDAFIKVNGEVFEEFALRCRQELDKVNSSVRMGFCSCITSWDIDGTTPDRISTLLAGNTKPFYRLIGAPYWAALSAWGHRLSYVIEQERLEISRRKNEDIEIFSEGDTYPRPRFRVPAAYLEGFDTALRASGGTDGILKYMLDYCSDYDYETGYTDAHIRNMPVYEEIDRLFGDKEPVGVRVFDNAEKFSTIDMKLYEKDPISVQNSAFSASARFLASNSVSSVHTGNAYAGIAFGEDARILTERDINSGLILDFTAAKILFENGIDTGFISENGTAETGGTEYFTSGEKIGNPGYARLHRLTLNEKAQVGSYTMQKNEKIPVFYTYENENGQRIGVYTFDGYVTGDEIFRNYCRQKQVISALQWLSGKRLPAMCTGHPDLYILTKQKDKKITVGLWNFCPDKIYNACVEFAENIKAFSVYGADGTAKENTVTLSSIDAFGFAAVEVTY